MTCAQLRTKTLTSSICRNICCVKSGFQILYAVEQFSSLFLKDKLKQGAHIHQAMIRLSRACRGRTAVRFPAISADMCCVELALKGFASAGKGLLYAGFPWSQTDGYAMLMSPSKAKQLSMAVTARVIWLCACVR